MICPWPDCNYTPKDGDPSFKYIKTHKYLASTERGYVCPKCSRSFITKEESVPENYYKKEKPITLDNDPD